MEETQVQVQALATGGAGAPAVGAGGAGGAGGDGGPAGNSKWREIKGELKKNPQLNYIRVQLNEQLKCLDGRLETQQNLVQEFQDIFRRRAEIEANYSKELEKLAKYITHRNKEQKQKREGWHLYSSTQLWESLVAQTKRSSRDHAALSEIYANQIVQRCSQINEDLQRIFRKCRDIGYEIHEEVLKVLHELHTAMKTHHTYQSEFRQAENKLQIVEKQRSKLQQTVAVEKREKHKKCRLIEKEYQKRRQKYDDARLKATKARNEYLLCMDSANSSIQKYFVDDLSDLIDCMDFGFHQSLSRAVLMHVSVLEQRRRTLQQHIDQLNKNLAALDSRLDKQRFIESNNTTFMIPKKFEYSPVRRDESEFVVQKVVLDELETRKKKLMERLTQLKTESEEIWKSMETAERSLSDMVGCNDYDTTRFFVEEDRSSMRESELSISLKQKADRKETEEFYMTKFREYVLNSNRIARLQAKYDHIRVTLGDQTSHPVEGVLTLTRRPNVARRRRIGNNSRHGQPKLFGGSLEEYLEVTNQDIPLVLKSCVRVINLYGLHHHGIFRVSGSQVEINHFRDSFERGDDPLAEMTDASDINSVAGLLKLYLRELREPIFPIQYFDHFMELAQLESKHEFVVKVRDVVKSWPRPVFLVMRYLFAFLNHLSEFSDENMMDPYNLAICFGPTLVPIPEERDQVQYQNLVNELIKNFIIFHEDIFPSSVPGPTYEKYLTFEPDDMGEAPLEQPLEDVDGDSEVTEDDSVFPEESERDVRDGSLDIFGKSEILEAQALYDFKARSSREVNFHKGDTIVLFKQVSNDWWRGSVHGQEGLIPDKYMMLKIRGEEERDRLESCRSIDDAGPSRERSLSSSCPDPDRVSSSSPVSLHRARRPSSTSSSSSSQPTRSSLRSASSEAAGGAGAAGAAGPSSARASTSSTTVISVGGGVSNAAAATAATTTTSATTAGRLVHTREPLASKKEPAAGSRKSLRPTDAGDQTSVVADRDVSTTTTSAATTHIIRVSGPVTNLDETVVSAEVGLAASTTDAASRRQSQSSLTATSVTASTVATSSASTAECERGPRSRLPLSPSLEARLRESSETSASRDSLVSTGSNQELQHQLDSTIAQVEAFAQEIEKRKKMSQTDQPTAEVLANTTTPKTTSPPVIAPSATATTAAAGAVGGARPRVPAIAPKTMAAAKAEEGIMLRQSSWGSRDQVHSQPPSSSSSATVTSTSTSDASGGDTSFAQNRTLWEKRTASNAEADPTPSPASSAPSSRRSSRDQGSQKSMLARQKQTPDLVLDLPVAAATAGATAQPTRNAANSAKTPEKQSNPPIPKPRTLATSPSASASATIQEVVAETSPKMTPASESKIRVSVGPMQSESRPFQSNLNSLLSKPQVRVKPQVQGRRASAASTTSTTSNQEQPTEASNEDHGDKGS